MYTEDLVSAVDAGNPVIPEKKRASRHTGPDRQEAENILDEAEREAQGKTDSSNPENRSRHATAMYLKRKKNMNRSLNGARSHAPGQNSRGIRDYEYEDPYEEGP